MRLKILIILVFVAAIAAVGSLVMRRELPFQFDVIRTSHGIAIVNQDTWNQRPLLVQARQNNHRITTAVIDPGNHSVLLPDLPLTAKIDFEISRQDLVGKLRYRSKSITFKPPPAEQAYVVLIGASIGKSWNLQEFGQRINEQKVVFSSRAHYGFDKTGTLMPLLSLKVKPDAVILKECSDYFPRDFEKSAAKLKYWIEQIKNSGIQPILATTTPVAGTGPRKDRQYAIDQWNAFVRDYGRKSHIPVLDLAGALQVNADNTYLKEDYAQDDGYHLTPAAYQKALDPLLERFTKQTLKF